MRGQTHVAIGVATTLAVMAAGYIDNNLLTIGAASIGSLLPDIDHDGAAINSQFGMNKVLYFIIAFMICVINPCTNSFLIALVFFAISRSKHRGITHSLIAFIFVLFATYRQPQSIFLGLNLGYITHLISDIFTDRGIQLLFPYKKKIKAPITFSTSSSTGRFTENIVRHTAEIFSILIVFYVFRVELNIF